MRSSHFGLRLLQQVVVVQHIDRDGDHRLGNTCSVSANRYRPLVGLIKLSGSVVQRYAVLYALDILPRITLGRLIRTVTEIAKRILNIFKQCAVCRTPPLFAACAAHLALCCTCSFVETAHITIERVMSHQ